MAHSRAAQTTRGMRRRNEKAAGLRQMVPLEAAILGIDLAKSKQLAVVTGPDHCLVARRRFNTTVWELDQALAWAAEVAKEAGLEPLVVACEPTGWRWKVVVDQARRRGLRAVLVPTMLVARGREEEDLTPERSDERDAAIIARRARELRCYPAPLPSPEWARLRHLGELRAQKVVEAAAARQRLGDLLASYWPAALEAASDLEATTLLACLWVATDPAEVGATDYPTWVARVGEALPEVGASRCSTKVLRAFWAAASDPRRLPHEQAGAAERAAFVLRDLVRARAVLAEVEERMVGVVEALGILGRVVSIPGLGAAQAAAILAETGDPHRYDISRTFSKHAGLCPRDNASGNSRGQTKASRRGRENLRTTAWAAVPALCRHNPVFAARRAELTSRAANPLVSYQARVALASMLLRHVWAVVVHDQDWSAELVGRRREAA